MTTFIIIKKDAEILQSHSPEQVVDELQALIMDGSANLACFIHQPKYIDCAAISAWVFCKKLRDGSINNDTHHFFDLATDDSGFWIKGNRYILQHGAA